VTTATIKFLLATEALISTQCNRCLWFCSWNTLSTTDYWPRGSSSLRWTACRMFDVLLLMIWETFKFTGVLYIYATLFFFVAGFLAPIIGKFKTQERCKEKNKIFMLFV
jgi:hypothetical protein